MPRDDITGRYIPMSRASTSVINRALVAAWREGVISDTEYKMTYAEVCEPHYTPQAFGGVIVPVDLVAKWTGLHWWDDYTPEDFETPKGP